MFFIRKWSLIVCLFSLACIASAAQAGTQTVTKLAGLNLSAQGKYIASKIQQVFPDAPIMLYVANCESTGLIHREPDGSLLPNSGGGTAKGVFQVLMRVHEKEFRRLGLDPNNDADYFKYVRILYDQGKTGPWQESKRCWRNHSA